MAECAAIYAEVHMYADRGGCCVAYRTCVCVGVGGHDLEGRLHRPSRRVVHAINLVLSNGTVLWSALEL
jgi:hypothetical protein